MLGPVPLRAARWLLPLRTGGATPLVPGVECLVDGQFDAGRGPGGALDLDVAFLGAAGAAQVVGFAQFLDRPAGLLVVGDRVVFGLQSDGLALFWVGDVAGGAGGFFNSSVGGKGGTGAPEQDDSAGPGFVAPGPGGRGRFGTTSR